MAEVIVNNVMVCALPQNVSCDYVSNTGRIASVTDRVDLWRNPGTFQGRAEGIELNSRGVDCENGTQIARLYAGG